MKKKFEKISIETNNTKVEIKINDGIQIPQTLYKYYDLTHYSINSFENSTVHFGHSYLMNDLLDGNFILWDFDSFLNSYMSEMKRPIEYKEFYRLSLLKQLSGPFLQFIGYFCLCENYKNDLLWAHYTSEKGYCIEFDTQLLFKDFSAYQTYFYPINYELKTIDFEKNIIKTETDSGYHVDANIPLFYAVANKEKFWSYEQEWRIVMRNESFTSITHPTEIISQEENKSEKKQLKSRDINISKGSVSKIILSTLFFNNDRFNKFMYDKNIVTLNFANNEKKELLLRFLNILKKDFSDRIYQVEKYMENGKVIRDIRFKIEILKVTDHTLEIIKQPIL
ncbi:DUF2971 domain-containing protein [uncultured Chryseobacterium sp.]|uniref:DUF2971 domain-containing protein n=1 Tax=uncultured Chryseobacterium sp. TaxID=259322 RepID=UPI0025D44810|nr:DUF2971 domain-containing protein [uncultured Chryseobacterium sp.]